MKKNPEKNMIKRIKDAIRNDDLAENLIKELEEPADKDKHVMNYNQNSEDKERIT